MSCSNGHENGGQHTLDALRSSHQAIARYRLILTDWSKPRKQQVSEIRRDLTLSEARAECDALNERCKANDRNRFGDPIYGIELTNGWDCMSETARSRNLAFGKGPQHFNK
jgi:hypothetical protein